VNRFSIFVFRISVFYVAPVRNSGHFLFASVLPLSSIPRFFIYVICAICGFLILLPCHSATLSPFNPSTFNVQRFSVFLVKPLFFSRASIPQLVNRLRLHPNE
jgi:hypothetical protein